MRPQARSGISRRRADSARRLTGHAYLLQTRLARDHRGRQVHLCRSRQRLRRLRLAAEGRRGAHHPLALRPPRPGGRRDAADLGDRGALRPHVGRSLRDELLHDAPGQRRHTAALPEGRGRRGVQHHAGTPSVPPARARGLRLHPHHRRHAHLHRRGHGAHARDEAAEGDRRRLPAREPALHDDRRPGRRGRQGVPIFYPYHYGEVDEKTDIDRLVAELEGVTEVRVRPLE